MYSMNHPLLYVYEDIARALLLQSKIRIGKNNVSIYLEDPFKHYSIWPVYPEIANRIGVNGDYVFVRAMLNGTMTLREFVEHSFSIYEQFDKDSFAAIGVSLDDVGKRLGFKGEADSVPSSTIVGNPYRYVREEQFWKNSVASVSPSELDPVIARPRFTILDKEKVATAGSCFAQHIARTLSKTGFNYFVAENAPPNMDAETGLKKCYGVFSARYGNIYTVRQLAQLLDRVNGDFVPYDELWLNRDGNVVDPFRPQIEPAGFADQAAMLRARAEHLAAVGQMVRDMDVFVYTLGLTEGWRSKRDGAVFPLAPGVAGGEMDFDRYEFVNFTVDQIIVDLHRVLDFIAKINPACRIILTVSPVPLIATYEPRHALVATTYSKSVLRTAADEIYRQYDHVEYFPSYEIITGAFNQGVYFDEDLRNVREEGVSHVMRIFMKHYAGNTQMGISQMEPALTHNTTTAMTDPRSKLFDLVCDEERIANH